jgi:hypothetical protein
MKREMWQGMKRGSAGHRPQINDDLRRSAGQSATARNGALPGLVEPESVDEAREGWAGVEEVKGH